MKKVVLSMALIAYVSLSSFTTQNDNTSEDGTINCRWRHGKTIGGQTYWGEWISGSCNVGDSGTLYPIQ
jgi:hypothetical protein